MVTCLFLKKGIHWSEKKGPCDMLQQLDFEAQKLGSQILNTHRLDQLEKLYLQVTEPRTWSYLSKPEKQPHFKISCIRQSQIETYYCKFSSAVRGISEPLNSFQLLIPLKGSIVTNASDNDFRLQPGGAFLHYPGDYVDNRYTGHTNSLAIRINNDALYPLLSPQALPKSDSSRIYFDTTQGLGQSFYNLIMQMCFEHHHPNTSEQEQDNQQKHSLEDLILYCLALTIENNLPDSRSAREELKRPKNLQVALDYINENLDKPILISDLTVITGVSSRALQKSFAKYVRQGPMSFIRTKRLEKAHYELLKASPNEMTVTDVAMNWQFYHPSDFAKYYLQLFGEHPSDTLRKYQ